MIDRQALAVELAQRAGRLVVKSFEHVLDVQTKSSFGYDRATSERTNLAEFARVMRRVRGVRRAGSAALDLAYVAAGRLDAYWEYGLKPWDWAAGLVLALEAGAEATNLEGAPFQLGDACLCVANPRLGPALRSVLVAAG